MLVAGRMAICVGVTACTMAGLFGIGSLDEEWSLCLTGNNQSVLFVLCVLNAMGIMIMEEQSIPRMLLWSVFGGCLLAASVMDWWDRMVYRFVWWAAGGAAGMLLLSALCEERSGIRGMYGGVSDLLSLMSFMALQQLLFARYYGRADCHAFCACAVMLAAEGQGFMGYVIHMALVFGSLTLVQFLRGNIARSGQLKQPVSLVPYITAAFWIWVDFTAGKWYI